jgi:hypothetical protein
MLTQLLSRYFNAVATNRKRRDEAKFRALEQWVNRQVTDLDEWVELQFPLSAQSLELQGETGLPSQYAALAIPELSINGQYIN